MKRFLKDQPFYNVPTEKRTKYLSNEDMLSELPFFDGLNAVKTVKAFKI